MYLDVYSVRTARDRFEGGTWGQPELFKAAGFFPACANDINPQLCFKEQYLPFL